jgi:nucleoid-associated protein YgaU
MRSDTKLAIVVAALCIVFGAWYIMGGKDKPKDSKETASQQPSEQKQPSGAEDESAPSASLAREDAGRSPESRTPTLKKPHEREHAASPEPSPAVTAQDTAPPRPEPTATTAPEALATDVSSSEAEPGGPEGVGLAEAPELPTPDVKAPQTSVARLAPATQPAKPSGTDTTAEGTRSAKPKYIEHKIEPGDTFSALAAQYLGDAKHAQKIAEANPGVKPRRLLVGQTVKIPTQRKDGVSREPGGEEATAVADPAGLAVTPAGEVKEPQTSPVPSDRAYKVKSGDGWYTLAERFLGSGSRWTELYELNKGRVPSDYNVLPVGTVIEVPKDKQDQGD